MAKFLNLDEVAAPDRSVKINGKEHAVLDMTVENFIETNRVSASGKKDVETQFEEAVKMLTRFIPTIPELELKQLTFEKINVLLKFVTGELDNEAQPKSGEAEPESGKAAETAGTAEKQ